MFSVLAIAIVLFVTDRVRLDIVALMVILALALGGVLTPGEAVSGFGATVVLLIAALFVVGEALYYTGIAIFMGDMIVRVAGNREAGLIVVLMLAVGILSAFMSSTGAVAIFIPVAVRLAVKGGLPPSRLLMPMAMGALIGGMLTLIGTPPNLIASRQLVQAGHPPFGFFDFTPIGLAILLAAVGYMLTVGRHLLPRSPVSGGESRKRRTVADLAKAYGIDGHIVRVALRPDSPLLGQTVVQAQLRTRYGLTVFGVERRAKGRRHPLMFPAQSETVFAAGDILYCVDSAGGLPAFLDREGADGLPFDDVSQGIAARELGLADVLLLPHSALIDQTLTQSKFRQTYDLSVLAIARKGKPVVGNFAEEPLAFGDALLVSGSWDQIRELRQKNRDFIVLSLPEELEENAPGRHKAGLAIVVVLAMLVAMALDLVPTVIAGLSAAVAMVLLRCVPASRIYTAINWESLVLIAGMLPMATALEKSGGLALLVDRMLAVVGGSSPFVVMGALFLLTSILSQVMSNTATTVLVVPVAYGIAQQMGIAPEPLLMTVALSASSAFATPVASPVNTLVLGPGKYRFVDFVKVGLPLQLLVMAVTMAVVPLYLPF
ncbi:MAG TPA: SLC13 family permease [Hyphomicrobiales bacterium]|nr:SLC13 family permease [Hyphomicrobiales bacterium]